MKTTHLNKLVKNEDRITLLEKKVDMLLQHFHGVSGDQSSPPGYYPESVFNDQCSVCGTIRTYPTKEIFKNCRICGLLMCRECVVDAGTKKERCVRCGSMK